jgi:anti-sigma-K factor RskA
VTDRHPEELIAAYILDALDEEERTLVEEHLARCVPCQRLAHRWREVVEVLVLAAPEGPRPHPDLRQRILAAAAATRPIPAGVGRRPRLGAARRLLRWPRAGWIAAALFLLTTIVSGLWNLSLQHRLTAAHRPLVQAVLQASPNPTGPVGLVVITDGGEPQVWISNLAPPGPGMLYELWVIGREGPRPAGTFVTDARGSAATALTIPAAVGETVAITLEPAPGQPRPSGRVLLQGVVEPVSAPEGMP